MAARRYSRRRGRRRLTTTGAAAWRRSGGTMTSRKRRVRSRVAGKKRRAPGYNRTGYKRRRQISAQPSEYSRFTTRMGRYARKTVKQAFKEIRAGQSKIVYSFRNFADFTKGSAWMRNRETEDGTKRYCPLYLYDLTCARVLRTVDGMPPISLDSQPMLTLMMNKADGGISWQSVPGKAHDGINMYELQCETDTANQVGRLNKPNSIIKYFNIKMNLFGCTNRVTKWHISLVQLKDDDLDPWVAASTPMLGNKYSGFWQSLVKPYMYNPISDQGTGWNKDLRILKSWIFIQNPQNSTDQDPAPAVKEFRCFIKKNMLCKWDNYFNDEENGAAEVADNGGYVVNRNAQMNAYLPCRKRIFLMIRAMNLAEDSTDSISLTPSFDFNIKTCHVTVPT